jgi:hypothetical protein
VLSGPRRCIGRGFHPILHAVGGYKRTAQAQLDGGMETLEQRRRRSTPAISGSLVITHYLWDPARNSIRVLGPDVFVLGAYTPPGADHSLLAWINGRPAGTASYRLAITETTTLRTQLISSPIQSSAAEFGRNLVGGGGILPRRPLPRCVSSHRSARRTGLTRNSS